MGDQMDKPKRVEFEGYFPSIQSAIRTSGNGEGMRVLIDIPEIEIAAAMHLMLLRGKVFKVILEEVDNAPFPNAKRNRKAEAEPLVNGLTVEADTEIRSDT